MRLFSNDVLFAVEVAISDGKPKVLQSLLQKHPTLIEKYRTQISPSLLHCAVRSGHPQIIELIIQSGIDVNHMGRGGTSPLYIAILEKMMDTAKFLISKGASPHTGQPIFATLNLSDERLAIRFIKLLITAGLELDRKYPLYGDKHDIVTALDMAHRWERHLVVEFLEAEQSRASGQDKARMKASKKKKAPRS